MNLSTIIVNFFLPLFQWGYFKYGNIKATLQGVRLGRGAKVSPKANVKNAAFIGDAVIGKDVEIGFGTYINSGQVMSGKIGCWCSIAYNVIIGPTEHDLQAPTLSPFKARKLGLTVNITDKLCEAPIIEDEVWLGANVIILKGVKIGKNAVIAAGAVVNKDVPANEIWGGVPAKFIKKRTVIEKDQS